MAFTASKREWSELYTFFNLLANGYVYAGTANMKKKNRLPIAMIQRVEHDGVRQYIIQNEEIIVKNDQTEKIFPRMDFEGAAHVILNAIKTATEDEVLSPDGVEEFLDELAIFNLEAKTEDRTDLHIAFYSTEVPLVGFCVRSRLARMNPLLDGGRAANVKFEQSGVKFPNPTVNKINAFGEEDDVLGRMLMIERLGGVLKYNDVADKIFKSNLCLIDLHFPRMIAEMTRLLHTDNVSRVSDLVELIKQINPLKIKEELITKHGYYEYKMKEFLLATAQGLRPAKIFNGVESAIEGMLFTDSDGSVLCYQKADRQTWADFLFQHTRLEKGSTDKDKYGYLEKENGTYYFKLNIKVGMTKR